MEEFTPGWTTAWPDNSAFVKKMVLPCRPSSSVRADRNGEPICAAWPKINLLSAYSPISTHCGFGYGCMVFEDAAWNISKAQQAWSSIIKYPLCRLTTLRAMLVIWEDRYSGVGVGRLLGRIQRIEEPHRWGRQCRCNMCNRVTWNDIGKEQWKTCWHAQCGVNKLSTTLSCELLSNEHVSLDSSRWIYFWSRVPSTVHMFGRHRWPHPYQDRESRNGCRACQCLKDLHSCEHGHGNGCIESMYCIHSCGIMQIMVLTWRW